LINQDASLDEVLNEGKGIVPNSNAEFVQIRQKNGARAISLSDYYENGGVQLPPWRAGDLVFVQRKSEVSSDLLNSSHPVIEMLGEVKTPGQIPFKQGADFLYYLTKAGGPSSVADLSRIEVIRGGSGNRAGQVYNWEETHELKKLEPNDIVVVHANQPTKFERFIQSASGVAAVLSAIGILIIAL
jgi:protein involved in polysaccharide export with SLBB domain